MLSYSPSLGSVMFTLGTPLSLCGVGRTQSQHLRFNGGGVGAGPEGAAFTGSHSTTLVGSLVRFIRFTLDGAVVHLLTQGRSRARRKKVFYTLTRNLFRLPRYHPCCDFYLLTTSIPWGSINFLTKAFSIYYPL